MANKRKFHCLTRCNPTFGKTRKNFYEGKFYEFTKEEWDNLKKIEAARYFEMVLPPNGAEGTKKGLQVLRSELARLKKIKNPPMPLKNRINEIKGKINEYEIAKPEDSGNEKEGAKEAPKDK